MKKSLGICFIDNLSMNLPENKEYKSKMYQYIPNIKTSKFCAECLSTNTGVVEFLDCALYKEKHKNGI